MFQQQICQLELMEETFLINISEIALGLIVAVSALLTASAADVGIHKKFLDSGCFLVLLQ